MISSLYTNNSSQVYHKKSLPKKQSSLGNQSQRRMAQKLTSGSRQNSKQKISGLNSINSKGLIQINYQNRNGAKNTNKYLSNDNKQSKSKSCQNSTDKIYKVNGTKTLYVGSSTVRANISNTLKKHKKQLEHHEFQYIGTDGLDLRQKQKNFFYQGHKTQKISQFKFKSKQLNPTITEKKKIIVNQQKQQNEPLSWNQSLIPYKFKEIIQKYPHFLTEFEWNQIKEYKNVYYIGHKVSVKQKQQQLGSEATKKGESTDDRWIFDNKENEYIYSIQDHIAYRYEIIGLMGKGSYGQVLKVFDHKRGEVVALKIVKNKAKFNQQAFVEIQILTQIKQKDTSGSSSIVRIKDFTIFRKHVCIVFELLSENLYELIVRNNYNGLNPELVRRFAIQILTCLQFLREQDIIHCDLKPQNILLREYNKSGIKVIDMGSSCFKNDTKYTYIQSRYYRAPEITLGIRYGLQIDIWSAGCILGELFTGIPMFPGENQKEQIKYFVKTLGKPIYQHINNGDRTSIFFNQKEQPFVNQNAEPLASVLKAKSIQNFQKSLSERFNDQDFTDFISGFLKWNPKQRFSPVQALNHKWIKVGLPPEISKILPSQNIDQKEKQRGSLSHKGHPKSTQKQVINKRSKQKQVNQQTSIRIKRSCQRLDRKSKQPKNFMNKD